MSSRSRKPIFFRSSLEFRRWLAKNHNKVLELWVGFYKKGSGKPSITYPQALDQALCFGWIDGVRYGIDDVSYTNRFSPRTSKSNWSRVNLKRFKELREMGLVRRPGLRAHERRDPAKEKMYSREARPTRFDAMYEKRIRANKKAFEFFSAQPPGYQRICVGWVLSAKQDETRQRRLDRLIDDSALKRRIPPLSRPNQKER